MPGTKYKDFTQADRAKMKRAEDSVKRNVKYNDALASRLDKVF